MATAEEKYEEVAKKYGCEQYIIEKANTWQ
jgi:hypothetical protein